MPTSVYWLLPLCFMEVVMMVPRLFPNNAWTLIFKLKAELNGEGQIVPFTTELAL